MHVKWKSIFSYDVNVDFGFAELIPKFNQMVLIVPTNLDMDMDMVLTQSLFVWKFYWSIFCYF